MNTATDPSPPPTLALEQAEPSRIQSIRQRSGWDDPTMLDHVIRAVTEAGHDDDVADRLEDLAEQEKSPALRIYRDFIVWPTGAITSPATWGSDGRTIPTAAQQAAAQAEASRGAVRALNAEPVASQGLTLEEDARGGARIRRHGPRFVDDMDAIAAALRLFDRYAPKAKKP